MQHQFKNPYQIVSNITREIDTVCIRRVSQVQIFSLSFCQVKPFAASKVMPLKQPNMEVNLVNF